MEEDWQQGGTAATPQSDEIDRVSCVSGMMLLYDYAVRIKSLAMMVVMVIAVSV